MSYSSMSYWRSPLQYKWKWKTHGEGTIMARQKLLVESTVSDFVQSSNWPCPRPLHPTIPHMQGWQKERVQLTLPASSTTSSSSEQDAARNMLSAGSEEKWASRFSRSPEPVKEDWQSEAPFLSFGFPSIASLTCEPQNRIHRVAPPFSRKGQSMSRAFSLWTCHGERIQPPWGLNVRASHKDYGCPQVSLSMHFLKLLLLEGAISSSCESLHFRP